MKKYLFYISILSISLCFSCQDEEIIDSKPGEAVDPVTNLNYVIAGDEVHLTWKLPADLPGDVIQPVSVYITITVDGQKVDPVTIEDAPESYTFSPYVAGIDHKFTVKVMASVDTSAAHESDLRYSPGNTVSTRQP